MSISKETRKVIIVMIVLVFIGITVAWFYYSDVNKSEDPRIVDAKHMYQRFQETSDSLDFNHSLLILDSIENIYNQVEYYKESFEIGVINNNRSAIFLTLALHYSKDSLDRKTNLHQGGIFAEKSIQIYTDWLEKNGDLSEDEIQNNLLGIFANNLNVSEKRKKKIIKKKTKEILEAQHETKRRLSVSHTNLGIVYRHNNKVEEAAECYKKAIDLWDRNLSAKNNLNIILDRPLEKQSFIEKMFPPDKKN